MLFRSRRSRAMTAITAMLRLPPVRFPVAFPACSLLTSCSEFALARRKAHGINGLDACGDQKHEISPVIFPDHGNLANQDWVIGKSGNWVILNCTGGPDRAHP